MANSIYRRTANTVQGLPTLQYSIIIDWTQDVSRVEQEALCIPYVDHDHEDLTDVLMTCPCDVYGGRPMMELQTYSKE